MKIRLTLIRAAALGCAVGIFFSTFGPFQSIAQSELIPLADWHFHALNNVSPQEALKEMDKAGVRWASSGSRGMDNFWLPYVQAAPERFIPFAGQGQIATMVRNFGEGAWKLSAPPINLYLRGLEQNLKDGKFRGIGEIIINNIDSSHPRFPGAKFPVDSPLVQRLLSLAGQYKVPLSFHVEADPDSTQEMERLLSQDKNTTVIWCHAGSFASAKLVGQFIEKYPNFYADLAVRDDRPRGPRVKTESIVGARRILKADWRALLESRSDRFFIGSDMLDDMSEYQSRIGFFRDVLAQLPSEVANRIGFENADRLFHLTKR